MGQRPPILFTCPHCGYTDNRVIDSRGFWEADKARRVRRCRHCEKKFVTIEVIDVDSLAKNLIGNY